MKLNISLSNNVLDFNQMTAMLFGLCLCGNETQKHLEDAGRGMYNFAGFPWFILQSYPFERHVMDGKACILLYDIADKDNDPMEFDDFPLIFQTNIIYSFAREIDLHHNILFCCDEHGYFNGEIVIDDVDVEMAVLFLKTYTECVEKFELS